MDVLTLTSQLGAWIRILYELANGASNTQTRAKTDEEVANSYETVAGGGFGSRHWDVESVR